MLSITYLGDGLWAFAGARSGGQALYYQRGRYVSLATLVNQLYVCLTWDCFPTEPNDKMHCPQNIIFFSFKVCNNFSLNHSRNVSPFISLLITTS